MMIATVILAAGESRRMGSLKQMLAWGQDTVLGKTINTFQEALTGPVFVVVGYEGSRIKRQLADRKVIWVDNSAYQKGMSSSIVAGIKALPEEVEGILLALADLPLLQSDTIKKIADNFRSSKHRLIVPVFQGRTGHPVLIAKEFFPELLKLQGDAGAKKIIRENKEQTLFLNVNDPGIYLDIDEPHTYAKLRATKGDTADAGFD
jgi:molybdenum cofactor cytidylyltransferase